MLASGPHSLEFHRNILHKAVPYASLWIILPPHGGVSDVPPVALQKCIVGHTSIKVCAVVAADVVTIDGVNNMILCG